MREVVLDTETTGLDPAAGHRIVEVACIELENHLPTGRTFHRYVNPERSMADDAYAVHGLSDDFLRQQPTFAAIADELLAFIGEDPLVIHNAEFDIAFLNAELARLDRRGFAVVRCRDTLTLARRKFPGAQASLDALCRRFAIDLSERELHGALIDCRLLAAVYLELVGGRQPGLGLIAETVDAVAQVIAERAYRAPRPHAPSADELAAHAQFLAQLKEPLWLAAEA